MCSKGTGSPPVPGSTSTAFQSATAPSAFMQPMYQNYISNALGLSQTPFNPAMLGTAAPMNAQQMTAGNQLYNLGLTMGNFDPSQVQAIESPFTSDVINATQNWFNNQNAIQGGQLLSGAIRSGNAFGGDRAGIAEAQLAGQQQLAQAPVIAGLRQAGYTQALDEYNRLKTFGLTGAQAALGWGNQQQAQAQREFDVAQQNAMMQSAYPFQLQNWYGSTLGGIGPLLGSFAQGYTTPPDPSALSQGLGIASSLVGLGSALFGKRGGVVGKGLVGRGRRHGGRGLVNLARRYQSGGSTSLSDPELNISLGPRANVERGAIGASDANDPYGEKSFGARPMAQAPNVTGAVRVPLRVPAGASVPQQQQQQQTTSQSNTGGNLASTVGSAAGLFSGGLGLLGLLGFLKGGGPVRFYADGGDDNDDEGYKSRNDVWGPPGSWSGNTNVASAAPTSPSSGGAWSGPDPSFPYRGTEGPPSVTGPARGSPAGPPIQATDAPNLMLTRERFQRALEDNPRLAAAFARNTAAEDPRGRDMYQAATMDRAAARGQPLGYTITDPRYYPRSTLNATGVNPELFAGANPANYATGNASGTVRFAGGPQTATSVSGERYGAEGPDRAYYEAVTGRPWPGPRGGVPTADGRGGYSFKIPGMEPRAKSFAERWAENPFTQIGAALLAGRSPYAGVNIGNALQTAVAGQKEQYKQELLDAKPKMVTSGDTIGFLHNDGTYIDSGIPTTAGNVAAAKLAQQQQDKPIVWHGPYGPEQAIRKPDGSVVDTEGNPLWPPKPPGATAPAAPAGPQAPTGTAPPTRQTEPSAPSAPPAGPTGPTGPTAPTGRPSPTATAGAPAATGQAQEPTANVPTRDISQPLDDDQKQAVALVEARVARGDRIKAPNQTDPKLLKMMGVTPEQMDFDAMRLAEGDTSVLQQRGTGKAAAVFKTALRGRANQYLMENGYTAPQANALIASFGAQKSGARVLANREANLTSAIANVQATAPRLIEISEKIPRSQLPKFNDIILAAQKQTGDPKVIQYGIAILTTANAYAQAISRGNIVTDENRRHSLEMLEKGFNNNQVRGAVHQMMTEMQSELDTTHLAQERYLGLRPQQRYEGEYGRPPATAPAAPPSGRRTTGPAAPSMSPQERAGAQQWLKDNPNHPDAARIKRLLGE